MPVPPWSGVPTVARHVPAMAFRGEFAYTAINMKKINLQQKFSLVHQPWKPKIVAELNGQYVKLVKMRGEFVWHRHEAEDELFLVVRGTLTVDFRDGPISLKPGEMIVVPAGIEHRPVADEDAEVLLFEAKSTLNTGNVRDARTESDLEWI